MIETADSDQEIQRIGRKIVEICEAQTADGKNLLLSDLGKLLGDDLPKIKFLTRSNLTDFLERNLPNHLRVAAIGAHRNIYSVIRVAADGEPEIRLPSASSEPTKPRFHYRFWAAFAVPQTQAGLRRFFNLSTFQFRDGDDSPQDGEYEIPTQLIPDAEIANRDATILANITEWLSQHNLDAKEFLAASQPPKTENNRASSRTISALEAMLSALDHRQLQAISLPLDAVAALLRKRV